MKITPNRILPLILTALLAFILAACTTTRTQEPGVPQTGDSASPGACQPTEPDMLGPFYEPGAPVREKVGEGYVLSGSVLSADGCTPIPEAMVELWMVGPDGEYADEYRATLYSGASGEYRFESHFPPGYSGRPPHIHVRVTAPGHRELVTQHYPRTGDQAADFDLVLASD